MIKKRKGSSIITILGVTLIVVLLSGMILKFTMSTMKSNINQKENEDVQFAAESGLEIGKSYLNNIAKNPPATDSNGNVIPTNYIFDTEVGTSHAYLPIELEKGKISDVKIKSEALANGRVKLTSEATDTVGKNKKISCELDIFQKNDNNIFDYGLVAGQGKIDIDITAGGVSDIAGKDPNKNIVSSGSSDNKIPPNGSNPVGVDKNKFGDLTFLENKQKSEYIEVKFPRGGHTELETAEFYEDGNKIEPTKIKVDLKTPQKFLVDGIEIEKNNLKKTDVKNIVLMKINMDGMNNIEILIANTKKLELITNETQLHLIKKVLLNGGIIKFSGTGSIDLVESTLYSEDIEAELELSLRIYGSLKDVLTDKSEEQINDIISGILPGWNNVTNVTIGGIDIISGSYE